LVTAFVNGSAAGRVHLPIGMPRLVAVARQKRRPGIVGSRLNLRGSAIDEERDTGDVARVVGRKEGNGRGDLVFPTGSAERRRA
jgi:hypothetical protein